MKEKTELNFDDIAGNKTTSVKNTPPLSRKKTGVILAIPTCNPSEWINKDLSDCSGEEFVSWAKVVYPIDLSKKQTAFENVNYRVQAFKDILHYHTTSLFQVGKEGKRNTTVH